MPLEFVPAGRPEQISDLVTKPSAITVEAILVLSTATGVSRTEGTLPPSMVFVVLPLVSEEVSVPLTMATSQLVAAISNGTDTSSLTSGSTTKTMDGGNVPSVLETPVSVDKTNIASTVIADGFVTKSEICSGLPAGTKTNGICP